jgi:hypothetical protein
LLRATHESDVYAHVRGPPRPQSRISTEEKKHVQQYAGRARLFIANVKRRRQTMLQITTCQQRAFLENGVRSPRALSRADICGPVGVHESKVSPATASKEYLARARSFGADLDETTVKGLLEVLYLRPLDLSLDEALLEIRAAVTRLKAERLVIDSFSGFELALAPHPARMFASHSIAWSGR